MHTVASVRMSATGKSVRKVGTMLGQSNDGLDVDTAESTTTLNVRLYNALFMVMHETSRELNMSLVVLSAFWILDLLFTLMFALGPGPALPWSDSAPAETNALHGAPSRSPDLAKQCAVVRGVWSFIGPVWFSPSVGKYLSASAGYNWIALYATIAGWMGAVIGIVVWLTIAFSGFSQYTPRWMFVALRVSARIAVQMLWVPIVINLVSPFKCGAAGTSRFGTELSCWSGGHVGLVVASCIMLPLTLAWHLLVALLLVNREADFTGKRNLLAATHGRVDAGILLLKAGLSALYVFGLDSLNVWVYLLLVLAASLVYAWAYYKFLPYHNRLLNGAKVAVASALAAAAICALVAQGLGEGGSGAHVGSIAWLLLLPGMMFSGWALVAAHTRSMAAGVNSSNHDLELSSPYMVDLRVRCMIAEAIAAGHDPRIDRKSLASSLSTMDRSAELYQPPSALALQGTANPLRHQLGGAARENEAVAVAMNDMEKESVRMEAQRLFVESSKVFSNSPMLSLFWAGFLSTVSQNAHLERLRLRDAADKADWSHIDVHFFCASRLEDIKEEENQNAASRMNVERRMRFEKLQASVRTAVAIARGNVLAFWSELSSKHPDLQKLKALGLTINQSLFVADGMFRDLLYLAPQSASIMRTYADFLLELANDPRKAQELLADAEQVEDDASKAHLQHAASAVLVGLPCSDFDLSADSVALMKVSSELDKLGAIYDVNGHACKLFGYSRRELMVRNLSDLIPAPIGALHNCIIARFLETGSMRLIGSNRITFCLHRAGYMFPTKINIRASLEGFAAVLDRLQTPSGEMYMWCMPAAGAGSTYRITAVCETSMALFGIDAPGLKAGQFTLNRFVENATEMIDTAIQQTAVVRTSTQHWSGPTGGTGAAVDGMLAEGTVGGADASVEARGVIALFHGLAGRGRRSSAYGSKHSSSRKRASSKSGDNGKAKAGRGKKGADGDDETDRLADDEAYISVQCTPMYLSSLGGQPFYQLRLKRMVGSVTSGWATARKSPRSNALEGEKGADGAAVTDVGRRDESNVDVKHSNVGGSRRGSKEHEDDSSTSLSGSAASSGRRSRTPGSNSGSGSDVASDAVVEDSEGDGSSDGDSPRKPLSSARGHPHTGKTVSSNGKGGVREGAAVIRSSQGAAGTHAVQQMRLSATAQPVRVPAEHHLPSGSLPRPVGHVPLSGGDISSCPVVGSTMSASGRRVSYSAGVPVSSGPEPLPGQVFVDALMAKAAPGPGGAPAGPAAGPLSPARSSAGALLDQDPTRADRQNTPPEEGEQPAKHLSPGTAVGVGVGVGPAAGAAGRPPYDRSLLKAPSRSILVRRNSLGERLYSEGRTRTEGDTGSAFGGAGVTVGAGGARGGKEGGSLVFYDVPSVTVSREQTEGRAGSGIYGSSGRELSRNASRARMSTGGGGGGDQASIVGPYAPPPLLTPLPVDGKDLTRTGSLGPHQSNGSVLGKELTSKGSAHHPSGKSAMSGGSATSATSITEILRRGVMARTGRLETSLRLTRWAVIVVFLVTAMLNLASLLVTQRLLYQMYDNLGLVYKNGRRAVMAQKMYSTVQAWAMAGAGLADPANLTRDGPLVARFADTFEALHQELFLAVDGSLPEEKKLYTDGSAIQVFDAVPGQADSLELSLFRTTNRTLNLGNGGIDMLSRVRRVLQMNASAIKYSNPDVFYIVFNGGNALREGLNDSMMLADERSRSQGALMKQGDLIILIVSECVFFFIVACVMVPVVLKVVASHHAVFETFIQVPLPILRALRASVQKRINAILKAEEEAEVGIDIGGKGNEIEGEDEEDDAGNQDIKALLAKEKSRKSGTASQGGGGGSTLFGSLLSYTRGNEEGSDGDKEDADDNDNATTLTGALAKYVARSDVKASLKEAVGDGSKGSGSGTGPVLTKRGGRKHKKRTYRRAGSDMMANLLAFIWPILLYMVYFGITYWYKGTIVDAVQVKKASLLWQAQAEMYMNLATIRVRFAAASCEPAYMTQQLDLASADLAFAEYLVDAVLYGSTERNVVSAIQTGQSPLPELWVQNGCIENHGDFYDLDECKTFEAGITSKGLLGAFRSFGTFSRQLIADRRAVVGSTACRPMRMNDPGSTANLVNTFGSQLLSVGFARATSLLFLAPTNYINAFYVGYSTIVAMTILALVALWFIFYVPLVARLDKDIKNVRLLLLLFPDEVARSVPAIVAAGRQLLQEAGSSAGSVASHSVIQGSK